MLNFKKSYIWLIAFSLALIGISVFFVKDTLLNSQIAVYIQILYVIATFLLVFFAIKNITVIQEQYLLNKNEENFKRFKNERTLVYQTWMEGYVIYDFINDMQPLSYSDIESYTNLKNNCGFMPLKLAEDTVRIYCWLIRYIKYYDELGDLIKENSVNTKRLECLLSCLPENFLDEFSKYNIMITTLHSVHENETEWNFGKFYLEWEKQNNESKPAKG